MSPLAQELLDAPPERWTFADWSDAVVAVTCVSGLLFLAGWHARGQWEADRRAAAPLPPVVERQNPPPLFPCDEAGRAEYGRMCRARERMAKVGGK